jgi:hypothetical protein
MASAVTTPSPVSARKAAAMITPSQKLWMLSPTSTLSPPRPACWASKWWWWSVAVALVVVGVAVELGLLQQPEEQQPAQQRAEQRLRSGRALEGLGQHVQQRRAQQHAGRQADQPLDDAAEHRQRQRGGDDTDSRPPARVASTM